MHTTSPEWLNPKEYPFTSRFITINNQKLHYIDEGEGAVILFVHGTPSWSFDNRRVINALRNQYRCIAIDHVGFGLSNKPKHYDYSTQNHTQTLSLFVNALQLKNITLVVHDFGGPIGLGMAINQPELIKRVVIMNSWLWDSSATPAYKKLRRILKSPLLPFLYRYLNFSPRFILPASFVHSKPSKEILKHYTSPFETSTQREGPLAFAYSLLNDQHWFEQLWQQKEVLVKKPVLLIWGMKDPIITPDFLDKFMQGFHQAEVLRLYKSGHFPQEEEPEQVVEAISHLMKTTTSSNHH